MQEKETGLCICCLKTGLLQFFICLKVTLNCLQLIKKTAARVLMRINRRDYIIPILAYLH